MIIIRCDSSFEIGGGHVKRCLTIAKELRERGRICEFISINYDGNIISEILSNGFKVRVIDKELILSKNNQNKKEFDSNKDISETIRLLNGVLPEIIIIDNYNISFEWELEIKKHCHKVVVIDDIAKRNHYCDVLLDHNYKKNIYQKYDKLTPKGSSKLLGTEYALLDPKYYNLQKKISYKKGEIKNILISFSGSDLERMTLKTLNAFISLKRKDIKINIVVNNNSPDFKIIKEKAFGFKNIKVYGYQKSLIPLMLQADYAIGAGGINTLERCCLGLPSSVISLAENQKHVIKYLAKDGIVRSLGYFKNISKKKIIEELNLILNSKIHINLSKKCMGIVDGLGTSKFVDFLLIKGEQINIRPTFFKDLRFIKSLKISKNDFELIKNFENNLRDSDNYFSYIAESKKEIQLAWINFINTKNNFKCIYYFNKLIKDEQIKDIILEKALKLHKYTTDEFFEINKINNKSRDLTNYPKKQNLKITFCSSKTSWINMFIPEIMVILLKQCHICRWTHSHEEVLDGDLCFYLSYEKIVKRNFLKLNNHNLVVHESDLPKGKGWSPLSWQILAGENKIPITIFEADEELDSGKIYSQQLIECDGSELFTELKNKQWEKTKILILDFINQFESGKINFRNQTGKETFFRKRSPKDSELDPEKSLKDQFNLIRIADSERYPNFFKINDIFYKLTIEKLEKENS